MAVPGRRNELRAREAGRGLGPTPAWGGAEAAPPRLYSVSASSAYSSSAALGWPWYPVALVAGGLRACPLLTPAC